MMKEDHKEARKLTRQATRERRKVQDCKVYELKINYGYLSREKKSYLNRLFLESKWFYNSIVGSEDIFKFDDKLKVVKVLNKKN